MKSMFLSEHKTLLYSPSMKISPKEDVRHSSKAPRALPDVTMAKVLVSLCEKDYSSLIDGMARDEAVNLVNREVRAAGFNQAIVFFRERPGHGDDEVVVILPEGSMSWPLRQLNPTTGAFLSGTAL